MPSELYQAIGWHTFNVPAGVTSVTIACNGAGSGASRGGRVTGRRSVSGSTVLKIFIGEAGNAANGKNGGAAAYGGGGPGGDGNGENGGAGGGGASYVRVGSTTGTVICIAGGAGGRSADNGAGGDGGAATGDSGSRGTSGNNSTGAATGGTQNQGGRGGTSSSGSNFNGGSASNGTLDRGGAGGDPGGNYGHGGGGGGGGMRAGGGGTASSRGYAPGGGGGGGSNYVGGLTSAATARAAGGTGNGEVSVTWSTPAPTNYPPSPPAASTVKIAGKAQRSDVVTREKTTVKVEAKPTDPDKDRVRLLIWSVWTNLGDNTPTWTPHQSYVTGWADSGDAVSFNIPGLSQDRHYWLRLYTQDSHGKTSSNYTSADFYTNRAPLSPTLQLPVDNDSFPAINTITFTWNARDPDAPDPQAGFQLRYRQAATSTAAAGAWTTIANSATESSPHSTWMIQGGEGAIKGNRFYEWAVRTKDPQGRWGPWNETPFSFYATGISTPPDLVSPIKGHAVTVDKPILFTWAFRDPVRTDTQKKADIRWRVVGTTDWITHTGDPAPDEPGANPFWTFPPGTLPPGYVYEWQVRTYDNLAAEPSDWSDSAQFATLLTPGSGNVSPPVPDPNLVQGSLGCGTYKVFLFQQGGQVPLGEITPLTTLSFGRVRDDISNCIIDTNGLGGDCGRLLRLTRSWQHELVVFRDGIRVWEGPITRITYTQQSVEIEAKDVMAYVYRRIMRQGYDDRFVYNSKTKKTTGGQSVVVRALMVITNALAPADPNVLPYLTTFNYPDDAQEGRIVPDYSTTAWEQVDDLAATAGLDYTVVGRRIILNDTHRAIGRLPEMRDGDFSNTPVVTEYGMQTCNFAAVTNNSGTFASAIPKGQVKGQFPYYGPIEMLASAYNEANSLEKMAEQAQRNVSGRWPSPLVVRIPDNSTVDPNANVTFDQLIPGVWIPLRSNTTLRDVSQWQKLDSVSVGFEEGVEQVQVVMSPAPNGGQDPDADAAAEAAE